MSDLPPANLSPKQVVKLNRVRKLAKLLDSAIVIPGTKRSIGLDPLLGLIPGGGDTLSAVLSAYIILEGALLGLPKEKSIQMIFNVLLDAAGGTFPVVGDLFDIVVKANDRNVKLIDEHFRNYDGPVRVDRGFLVLLTFMLLIMVFVVVAIAATGFFLIRSLFFK
jgi:hypothetical protein